MRVTADRTDTVRVVANRMRGRSIGCVPVVDRERLIGIVTVSDLLEALGRGIDRPGRQRGTSPSRAASQAASAGRRVVIRIGRHVCCDRRLRSPNYQRT